MVDSAKHIVIIGAGLCGGRAALTLREKGFLGRVTLIGDERELPYDRPPLSKQVLLGAKELTLIAAREAYQGAGIELIEGMAAARIDRDMQQLILVDGMALAYDRLLLATGARPRSLPNTQHLTRLITLRTYADALAIRERLGACRRLIVIGGGFIGLEVAASARQQRTSVLVVEGLPRLMARVVPQEIASVVEARHRAEGVEFVLNATVSEIAEDEAGITVTLADGSRWTGDLVLAGVGAVPNTRLAEECGLVVNNGIAVDAYLATSDPDIFAAGDCCSFPSAIYGNVRLRLESWRSAQDQGILVASNLLGGSKPFVDVPWFWSDQYDLTLQIAGLAASATATVRRDLGEDAFLLFHLDADGHLVAASGIGRGNSVGRDIRLAEMLITARARPDRSALASSSIKLKSLLAA